jgi:hypothetical protein
MCSKCQNNGFGLFVAQSGYFIEAETFGNSFVVEGGVLLVQGGDPDQPGVGILPLVVTDEWGRHPEEGPDSNLQSRISDCGSCVF